MKLRFWKVEAIGNDFPLIHLDDVSPGDLPELAIALSDRKFGVGGDGLLAVGMEEGDVRLRMFNPDGTEDFCGNGLRCAALHVHRQGWVGASFNIRHLDRVVPATVGEAVIATRIGVASYFPDDVPTTLSTELFNVESPFAYLDGRTVSSLTTGSTHTIVHGLLPSEEEFQRVSPLIENDPIFPHRTSVIWAEEEGTSLRIRIWERGVGETLGCGTGSSAAAVDYFRRKGANGSIVVHNPGGSITVSVPAWNEPITVQGEAHEHFVGLWGCLVTSL